MAHVQKLTAGAMGGLENHCTRKSDKHKNTLIDPKKTPLNYALDNNEKPLEYFKQRIGEVRINQRRDDIKVAASWVITQPRGIQPEESKQFFETAHNFLAQKYGEKNVIWSRVHMDESTPHLHFCFVPVTPDKKHNGEEKLCAKDVLNRGELQKFHGELSAEMKRVFGRDVGIETGQTEKNVELEKLKLKKGIDEIAKEYTEKKQQLDKMMATRKSVIDGRKLAKELSENHEASYLNKNNLIIKRDLLQKAMDYILHSGGKDADIAKLKGQIEDLKTEVETNKKYLSIQSESLKQLSGYQQRCNTVEREVKEQKKIIEIVEKIAPGILKKAAEHLAEQKRGRGFGR